jgi:cytochrome c553
MNGLKFVFTLPVLVLASACNSEPEALQASAAAGPAAKPAAASTCLACHQGERSLAGQDADEVAANIRAILDGEIMHAPLGLDDRSDEAIAAIAAALTEG